MKLDLIMDDPTVLVVQILRRVAADLEQGKTKVAEVIKYRPKSDYGFKKPASLKLKWVTNASYKEPEGSE